MSGGCVVKICLYDTSAMSQRYDVDIKRSLYAPVYISELVNLLFLKAVEMKMKMRKRHAGKDREHTHKKKSPRTVGAGQLSF